MSFPRILSNSRVLLRHSGLVAAARYVLRSLTVKRAYARRGGWAS